MRIPIRQRTWGMPINMTPMIDVVFQLIVYFVATSHLARLEHGQSVDLPRAAKARQEAEAQGSRLMVNVLRDGSVFVGSRWVAADAIEPVLQAELGERSKADLEIRIRADRAVPYRFVEPILLACARVGVWRIAFAVLPEEPGAAQKPKD